MSPGYSFASKRTRTEENYRNSGFFIKAGFENHIDGQFFWSLKAVGSQFEDEKTFLLKGAYYGDTTLSSLPLQKTLALGLEIGILWRLPVTERWNLTYQARIVFYDGSRYKTKYIPGMGINGIGVTGGISFAWEYCPLKREKMPN